MIEKTGSDEFELVCDVCDESPDETFETFYDAVEYKPDHGWKSRKVNGSWQDICPRCQKEAHG